MMICTHSKLIIFVFQDGAAGQQGQEASHGAQAQNSCEKSSEPAPAEQLKNISRGSRPWLKSRILLDLASPILWPRPRQGSASGPGLCPSSPVLLSYVQTSASSPFCSSQQQSFTTSSSQPQSDASSRVKNRFSVILVIVRASKTQAPSQHGDHEKTTQVRTESNYPGNLAMTITFTPRSLKCFNDLRSKQMGP